MKYVLLLYGDEGRWADMTPEEAAEDMKLWSGFGQELTDSGAFLAGEGLDPTTSAVTVRIKAGEVVHTDGPFAETREQLGGFYLLECADLDAALAWAAKVPDLGEGGAVEVRPVMDYEAAGYEQPEAAERSQG
jgi:hypothetical protein